MGNRLSKIYTRTGDDGTTGLGDGSRVPKDSARVEAYGTVDELNSVIGVLLAVPGLPEPVTACLTEVQHELFDLGGELCIPGHTLIRAEQVTRLERSLDYRPVTALFGAAVLASIAFMYMNTKAELAPEEDQGVLFALTKAPQYANLDYAQAYEGELDRGFTSFPETYLRFIVNGRFGPNQGIAGVILKPWNERTRSAQQLKPLLQRKVDSVEGLRAFVFSLPPLPYPEDALAPVISGTTIGFHYGKHHRAYVDNLNKAIEGTDLAHKSLEDILKAEVRLLYV